jgi:hypothetical protein
VSDTPSIDYTSRDFASIQGDLVARARTVLPEWSASDASDFGVTLLELWAHAADVLHYYIDRAQNETYLSTATRRSSVLALAELFGYRPSPQTAATGAVTFTRRAGITGDVVIPARTTLLATQSGSTSPVVFETTAAVTLLSANPTVPANVEEGTSVTNEALGTSSGLPNQVFTLYYTGAIDSSVEFFVAEGAGGADVEWTKIDYLLDAEASASSFATRPTADGRLQILLGDGVTGRIPPVGLALKASYRYGVGVRGNVAIGAINRISGVLSASLTVSNAAVTAGGADWESIESMRLSIPQSLRSQNRAVTLQDFSSLALKVPGVNKANAFWDSGTPNTVNVYIGGATSAATNVSLRNSVDAYVTERAVVGKDVSVLDRVLVTLTITATVYVLPNHVQSIVKANVEEAIRALYSWDKRDFGERLKQGDLYRTVMDVTGVDYVTLAVFSRTGSGVSDILLDYDEIAELGTLTLTASGGL